MKKTVLVLFPILLAILLCASILLQLDTFRINPLHTGMPLENPLIPAMDSNRNIYVIDRSMKRIVKLDSSGNVLFAINGGSRSADTFFYAQELVPGEDDSLYVLSVVLDENGQYVEQEDILRYRPDGRLDGIVYSVAYTGDDKPLRKGRLSSLSENNSSLYCYSKGKDGFRLLKISLTDHSASEVYTVDFPGTENMIVDFATSYDPAYSVFTTKKGEMYKADASGRLVLFHPGATAAVQSAAKSIPWEVEPDGKGGYYFIDLGQKQIRLMDGSGKTSVLLSDKILRENGLPDLQVYAYRLTVSRNGSIGTVLNGQILFQDSSTKVLMCTSMAKYPIGTFLLHLLVWLQLPVLVALLVFLAWKLYQNVLRGKVSTVFKLSTFLVAAVTLCSLFLSNMIFSNYNSRYEAEVFNQISQNIQLISRSIDGDKLNGITKAGDFMGEDYQKLSEALHASFNENSDIWNEGFYGAIYKVEDNQLYAIAYYDDSVCPYYPLYSEPDYIYMQSFREKSILTLKESDAEGDWMYGVGPIFDSGGKIAGLLEVGTDLYGFTQENARLRNNLILEIATILVVLILILIEVTILSGILAEKRRQTALYPGGRKELTGADVSAIRPLCFLIFSAGFMSQSFIPLLMKKLYVPMFGLSETLVLGLPLSAEALFVALSAVAGGYLIDRRGWKPVFLAGLALFTVGQVCSGFAWNAPVFLLARVISGTGFGLSLISMQSFVIMPSGEDNRNRGISAMNSGAYAGINTGVVIGSLLAERIGFSSVFFVSSFLTLLSLILGSRFMRNHFGAGMEKVREKNSIKALFRFLFNKRVFSFLVLVFIPIAILLMFLEYYFPLFSESQNLSTANIGRAFLLNGLAVVYLGPVLSKYITKWFGDRITLLISGLITVLAIIQFSIQGTLISAFLAVILLGVSESFGITAKISYFTSLPAVRKLGEGKALGYYGLAENLGQVLGPILYGSVIGLGIFKGIGSIGIAVLVLLTVFSLVTARYRRYKTGNNASI